MILILHQLKHFLNWIDILATLLVFFQQSSTNAVNILPVINQKRRDSGLQCMKNQYCVKGTDTLLYNDMKPGSFLISPFFTAEISVSFGFRHFVLKLLCNNNLKFQKKNLWHGFDFLYTVIYGFKSKSMIFISAFY